MFNSTLNKGFQMTFENGYTISVQFGYGNYCDNRTHVDGVHLGKKHDIVSSNTAEICIWDCNGVEFGFGSDTVKGYCSADEVAEWISKVSKFK